MGPDPKNPYKSYQADVDYFGGIAIIAGGTFSAVFLICLLIYDITGWFEKRAKQKELEKYTGYKHDDSK